MMPATNTQRMAPPAGGPGMLAAALAGGNVDSMGGDEIPQVAIDFPLQGMIPTLDDGMMMGGFPGGNMLDPDAQLLQQLLSQPVAPQSLPQQPGAGMPQQGLGLAGGGGAGILPRMSPQPTGGAFP